MPEPLGTILLVEDEASLRELITEFVEAIGYAALAAESGRQALEMSERHEGPIHLLLTDLLMPGMDGVELARRLREGRPDIRVLYMSGYTEEAVPRSAGLERGDGLISKPFTQEALARRVQEALARPPQG